MQTPEPMVPPRQTIDPYEEPPVPRPAVPGYWGERLAWTAGLVLLVSVFTDWYAGSQADGLTLSVTGWHTGSLGKLVFFCALAALCGGSGTSLIGSVLVFNVRHAVRVLLIVLRRSTRS